MRSPKSGDCSAHVRDLQTDLADSGAITPDQFVVTYMINGKKLYGPPPVMAYRRRVDRGGFGRCASVSGVVDRCRFIRIQAHELIRIVVTGRLARRRHGWYTVHYPAASVGCGSQFQRHSLYHDSLGLFDHPMEWMMRGIPHSARESRRDDETRVCVRGTLVVSIRIKRRLIEVGNSNVPAGGISRVMGRIRHRIRA